MTSAPSPLQLCFIGDSFVAGVGDETALGWTGRLVARAALQGHPVTAYNLGIRRNTSTDIRARQAGEVAVRLSPERRTRLVFSFGVNDATHVDGSPRVSLEESFANLSAILVQASDFTPFFVGPPAVDDERSNAHLEVLNAGFRRICTDLGVPYVDTFSVLVAHPLWRQQVREGDGAHPRSQGYAVLAETVAPAWDRWFTPGVSPGHGE